MVYLDGFSGYGGFHLGLEQAGFKFDKVYFSEIDKNAIANYKYNFPNSIYAGSITTISRNTIPEGIDLFTFGWPCQDNSIAGKRKGQSAGTRSGLLYEAVRIINEFKPRHFIAENVTGLLSVNEGVDYIKAIELLSVFNESCPQYDIEMQLLNTKWVLPQNRERLYFVGHLRGTGSRQIFPLGEDHFSTKCSLAEQQINGNKIKARALTETRTEDAKAIRKENMRSGKDFSPRRGKEIVPRKDELMNTLTANQSKEHFIIVSDGTPRIAGWHENENVVAAHRDDEKRSTVSEHVYHKEAGTLSCMTIAHISKIITHYGHKNKPPKQSDISPTLKAQSHGHEPMVIQGAIRKLTEIEYERLQGLPDDWTKYGIYDDRPNRKDLLHREMHPEMWAYYTKIVEAEKVQLREIASTRRYTLCGNGVSVPIVKAVGSSLFKSNYGLVN